MKTSMATSTPSVDSHHAADIPSDNTTVALLSYNIGITNKDVQGQGWAKSGGKRLRLKSDIEKIFTNQHGIQIALISEFGNMVDRLSTAEAIFLGIITELGLTNIQVFANAPYVALIDTMCWRVILCELIGNLCEKKSSSFSD